FLFLFLTHAFAILRFSEPPVVTPTRLPTRPFFYFSLDAASDQRVAELTGWRDPLLFAMPHARGFSGGAWLSFRPEGLQISNWSAPPEWLSLPVDELGNTLHRYVATNHSSEERLLDSLRAPTVVEVRLPDAPVITKTSVRIEGPLAARKAVIIPPLPSAVSAEVLQRTIVLVSVNGDGLVETASVIAESGSKVADGQAVEVARQFAFAPLPIRSARARENSTPTLGRLAFTWHVTTNNAVAAATP
ncbi:MAG TPA: energy transducer TonB, partial [Candidatus Limnocylindria bacterium]|nr:energy transducer TonB [Candidatus Limnocylindria bacterium]